MKLSLLSILMCVGVPLSSWNGMWAQKPSEARLEKDLSAMSLEEKIGQLLVPAVTPSEVKDGSPGWAALKARILKHHVGGIHVFRGSQEDVVSLISRAQRVARRPLLITADFEGGVGSIVYEGTRFPRGMGLAATGDEELIRQVAAWTSREGHALGFNVNFYPVLDVNINPRNPIINLRAFGEDPQTVATLGAAYIKGMQEGGHMLATGKHFPGHGDTESDSHLGLPVVRAGRARLNRVELPPFRRAVKEGVGAIMSAHIAWPAVTGSDGLPATLDPLILQKLLRIEMGFDGLVFTDALNMKGITERFSVGEAAKRAVLASANALLFAEDEVVHPALVTAAKEGQIPGAVLTAAVRRVLRAKYRLGLMDGLEVSSGDPSESLRTDEARQLAATVIQRSFVLVQNQRLPLQAAELTDVVHVSLVDPGQRWFRFRPNEAFSDELQRRLGRDVRRFDVRGDGSGGEEALAAASKAGCVLVTVHTGLAAFRGRTGLSDRQLLVLERLRGRKTVLAAMGNPYALPKLEGFGSVLLAFDAFEHVDRLAAQALFGDFALAGHLPVTLPGFKRGHGLRLPKRER